MQLFHHPLQLKKTFRYRTFLVCKAVPDKVKGFIRQWHYRSQGILCILNCIRYSLFKCPYLQADLDSANFFLLDKAAAHFLKTSLICDLWHLMSSIRVVVGMTTLALHGSILGKGVTA